MTNESPRREPQSADPYTEPPNSTVDDWHGQEVERNFEADRSGADEHATGERQARENAEVEPPA